MCLRSGCSKTLPGTLGRDPAPPGVGTLRDLIAGVGVDVVLCYWSWDITKLHGPAKWTYYYLYVILDIYARYAVGWLITDRESADTFGSIEYARTSASASSVGITPSIAIPA
jgi:transposase InsO family protein